MSEIPETAASPPASLPLGRREWIALAAILLGAFLIRLIYVLQYQSSPTFDAPVMDPLYHVEWARAFANGEVFMKAEPYFRAPLYPWFLGVCFELFGENFLVPRIFQAMMDAASCALVFLIGRRLLGSTTGIAAGIVAATYWYFVYFTGELLLVPLIVFLDLLFVWLLLRAEDHRTWWEYALAGLVLGLSAIARPNILLFGLAVCIWTALRPGMPRLQAFGKAFVMGAVCLAPILPITIRNKVVGDDLVLISSQAGVNFYIGNNRQSDGTRAVVPGTRPDWWGGYRDTHAMAAQEEGRELKASEVSQYFLQKAFDEIGSDPTSWLSLTSRKFRYFWTSTEIHNNQPMSFFAERYGPIVRFLPIGFGLVAPLSLLGLVLCLRRPRRLFPLWGFVVLYGASVVFFFVCTRFRMPVEPILVILACEAVRWLVTAWWARRWIPAAIATIALVPVFWWSNTTPKGFVEDTAFQGHEIVANSMLGEGNFDGAIEELHKGLQLRDYAGLRVKLALALVTKAEARWEELYRQGRPDEAMVEREGLFNQAEQELNAVLAQRIDHADDFWGPAEFRLGYIAARRNDLRGAIGHFERALVHDPNMGQGHAMLGHLLVTDGRPEMAIDHLVQALKGAPDYAMVRFDLGKVFLQTGRAAEALPHLTKALELLYPEPEIWLLLATALEQTDRSADATRVLRDGLSRLPAGHPLLPRMQEMLRRLGG